MNNAGIEIRNFFYPLNKQKIYKKFAKKKNYVTDNFYKKGILTKLLIFTLQSNKF